MNRKFANLFYFEIVKFNYNAKFLLQQFKRFLFFSINF